MLGGDWNDGMNGIGKEGKGESVWLGWFLYSVISRFLPICRLYNAEDEQMLKEHAKKLVDALNTVCWDGQWYRRAFDDEGKIIGASDASCCRIDAISQAWAVLSGAGKPDKCKIALDSLDRLLIDKENGIVKLLTPPFTKESGAGYIGEYLSGVPLLYSPPGPPTRSPTYPQYGRRGPVGHSGSYPCPPAPGLAR